MEQCDQRIDDLQKIDVLYKIINYRYLNNSKTIISSELKLLNYTEENAKKSIMDIDSAIAGRIYERTNKGQFAIGIPNKKNYNVRFQKNI